MVLMPYLLAIIFVNLHEIEKEKEFYKKSLERIPRFIIRLLGINKKYLGEGK